MFLIFGTFSLHNYFVFSMHVFFLNSLNPNWHELWKQEKCSSLEPPMGIFCKTWQGVELTRLMSIFTSKKVWKFLIKIQLPKIWSKRTRGGNCTASCQLGLTTYIDFFFHFDVPSASTILGRVFATFFWLSVYPVSTPTSCFFNNNLYRIFFHFQVPSFSL